MAAKRNRLPPRPPISQPDRLKRYSDEHLAYEMKMLFRAVRARPTSRFFNNARIEAFANHARNLIVFLYPDLFSLMPDDVAAHHFLASSAPFAEWRRIRPPLVPVLRRAKVRADKELAHLTARRIAGRRPQKAWDMVGIARALRSILQVFVSRADPARLGAAVAAAIPSGPL